MNIHSAVRLLALSGLAACSLAPATLAVGPLRPVALTGTDGPLGPGLGPGITFSNMTLVKTIHPQFGLVIPSSPVISASGSIVFGANLAGPGISTANGSGIFAARGGTGLSLVARRGDPVPNMEPGFTFGELYTQPQISAQNTVAFQAVVEGLGAQVGTNEVLVTERSGWLFPLVREGVTPVPNAQTPSGVFGGADPTSDPWGNNQWVMNRHGDVAFRCFVNDPPFNYNNFSGIYTDFGGPLSEHSRPGQSITVNGTTHIFYGQSIPRFNDSGAMFTTRLSDAASSLTPWATRARNVNGFGIPGVGPLHPVYIQGEIAPGTNSPFASVWSLREFSLNANGRVAFAADLDNGGPGAPGGFWSDARFGVTQLIALSGAAAPGTNGASFNTNAFFVLGSALADNNCLVLQGQLQQSASVGGGNDTALWTTRSAATGLPGNLRLLIREGTPVPASAGPDYEGLNFGQANAFWVNASGRVAFTTLHNDFTRALWIEQPDGSLLPVVKEFTFITVAGVQRLIAQLEVIDGVAGTGDGRKCTFNDQGAVAVRLVFVDGAEGIFTTADTFACQAPAESSPPDSQNVFPGETVTFTVGSTGTRPIRHQWLRDGQPIASALEATLTLHDVSTTDVATYTCVLTSACGTITSSAATLSVGSACPPDLNGDGTLDPDDLSDYIACYFAVPPCNQADYSGDGNIDPDDLADYIGAFFTGCP